MNYKILAASAVISAGVIAFGLYEARTPQPRVAERLSAVQVAAPVAPSYASVDAYPRQPDPPPPPAP